MKSKILAIILIFNFIGVIPYSCKRKCDGARCECQDDSDNLQVVEEMTFSTTDSSSYLNYQHISMNARVTKTSESSSILPSYELIPSAVACDPDFSLAKQTIYNIEFIALNTVQYNSTTLIDSLDNINPMIKISDYTNYTSTSTMYVNEFLTQPRQMSTEGLYFYLAAPPEGYITLKYKIKITLSDGKIFESPNLQLKTSD